MFITTSWHGDGGGAIVHGVVGVVFVAPFGYLSVCRQQAAKVAHSTYLRTTYSFWEKHPGETTFFQNPLVTASTETKNCFL